MSSNHRRTSTAKISLFFILVVKLPDIPIPRFIVYYKCLVHFDDHVSLTVNSEIFASILFSRIVLKDIFAMFGIHRAFFTYICKQQNEFSISRGFYFHKTYAKFRENKTLAKISEFTVSYH